MTNTLNKIMHDGDEYLLPDTTYTAGSGINIDQNNEISNTGVTSFNGQTGAVTYTAPVSSVNSQTGAVTVLESQTKVFPMPEVGDDISDIISWLTANKQVILLNNPSLDITYEYYRVHLRYTDTRDIVGERTEVENSISTGVWINYSNANIVEAVTRTTKRLVPTGGTAGQVLTQSSNGLPGWQTPSGGDVVISSQTGNILQSGMGIWAGTETDYGNLSQYDSNCLYLTIE